MGFFSPVARDPSAEGRSILMLLMLLSNYYLKIRIHSFDIHDSIFAYWGMVLSSAILLGFANSTKMAGK
jgi:hypothetical protein